MEDAYEIKVQSKVSAVPDYEAALPHIIKIIDYKLNKVHHEKTRDYLCWIEFEKSVCRK